MMVDVHVICANCLNCCQLTATATNVPRPHLEFHKGLTRACDVCQQPFSVGRLGAMEAAFSASHGQTPRVTRSIFDDVDQ